MSESASIIAQKIFERTNKTHAKILISAKRRKSRQRRRPAATATSSRQRQQRKPTNQQQQQQRQRIEHQQRVNRIRNDKTQTLAQRKEAIERENYRFRSQQQQQQQQPEQRRQRNSEERVRQNSREAKYTSRYLNQRRPRRYYRRRGYDGTTVVVAGGSGGGGYPPPLYGIGGGGGYLPYGGVEGEGVMYPTGQQQQQMPYYAAGSSGESAQYSMSPPSSQEESSEGLPSIVDTEKSKRILNRTSLRQTHVETRTGEFRVIPALEGVDTDVINEYLRLRDAFDDAETSEERIRTSVAFVLFTQRIDRIFKTHAEVYVRAMKVRPATMTTQDVEALVDSLARDDVDRIALLSNEEIRAFLLEQIK